MRGWHGQGETRIPSPISYPGTWRLATERRDMRSDLRLCAHRRQVVAPRQVVNIRSQSSPITCGLRAVIPLGHYLVDAARAVHDLLHLYFCLQIVRSGIEFATE